MKSESLSKIKSNSKSSQSSKLKSQDKDLKDKDNKGRQVLINKKISNFYAFVKLLKFNSLK